MKTLLSFAVIAGLAGCMTASDNMSDVTMADGAAAQMLMTEAQFREVIVGKTINFNGNTLQFNADGTLSGPWDGQGIQGEWTWEDGATCRTASIGTRVLEPDCQTWVVEGSKATVTRNRGEGASFVYEIS